MKYLKIKRSIVVYFVLGAVLLQACNKGESYDIMGDAAYLAYVTTVGQTPVNGASNQVTFKALQAPVGTFSDIRLKLPVRLNKSTSDVTVSMDVDNSLVQDYNSKYGTACRPLPESAVTLTNTTLTIKEGATMSQDSVYLLVDNAKVAGLAPGDYLLPLRLVSVSDGVQISTNLNTIYVKIEVLEVAQLARENVSSANMPGTLISSYTGWSYTSSHTTSPITNLWSTSSNSFLTLTANPATITFNMNASHKISGIRLFSRSATSTTAVNTFSHVKFSLSKDGVTYTEIANFPREKMNTESGYQYIAMHMPMEARYIKLELSSPLNGLVFFGAYRVL